MAKTSKTTNSTEAKKAAPKKGATAKAASTAPQKTAPAKRAPAKKPAAKVDPAEQLEKVCKDAVAKFQKMENGKYQEVREKLEWCIGSYSYDKNPEGMVAYGRQASDALKEIRGESPKKVSKKLVDDLDKALARF